MKKDVVIVEVRQRTTVWSDDSWMDYFEHTQKIICLYFPF